jgi:ribosomal protein S18 acetylase RimI-like enzyme
VTDTARVRALNPFDARDADLGRSLVHEYVEATIAESVEHDHGIDRSLTPQLFPEIADFAAVYGQPGHAYLVAEHPGATAGGVGLRPLGPAGVCEMKRLWIRFEHRGGGLARTLTLALLDHARSMGYDRMVLDVVPYRTAAIALYRSIGFTPSPPTREYPFPIDFFARDL